MKLQSVTPAALVSNQSSFTRELYNRYSGMLLGYLTDVVTDRQLAENYLIEIFNDLPLSLKETFTSEKSVWLQLQRIAKNKLASFIASQQECRLIDEDLHRRWAAGNSNFSYLSAEQRTVFCGIYYHRKSIGQLGTELNQPEYDIKRILKDAFSIIKNGR